MTDNQFIDHAARIVDACNDATGESPPADAVLSKIDRWLRYGDSKAFALKVHSVDGGYIYLITDHMTGETFKGCTAQSSETFTPEQRREFAKQRKAQELARAERLARKDRMLSAAARRIWKGLMLPDKRWKPFPYMVKKNEPVLNARFFVSRKRDVMVLPMVCPFGGLRSLYLIDRNGFKRPLLGTAVTGLMMAISDKPLSEVRRIGVCEGYATGLTVHRLFDVPVVVAFTCHNLLPVIEKLRRKYPNAELVLFADNDADTFKKRGFNPGIDAAKTVQAEYPDIEIVIPDVPAGATGISDFNDLAIHLERAPSGGLGGEYG